MQKINIPCPVCGKYIFNQEQDFDICKYCGWENDGYFESGGANDLSLDDYTIRYNQYLELNPKYIWKKDGFPKLSIKDRCKLSHKFCQSNEKNIEKSQKCGCFFCGRIFDKILIVEWIEDTKGKTALCPFCGIDSILPDSKVEISKKFLKDMHRVWFK